MAVIDLSGLWQCEIPGQKKAVHLPGTLDENGVGHPDRVNRPWHPDMADPGRPDPLAGDVITSRFTRRFTYEGPAAFTRLLETRVPENERVFLDVERSRHLTLRLNGREIPALIPGTVSTPYTFELTGLLTGRDEIPLICDNTYPGWPAADITCASAATDETQTNWNGVLGYLRLRTEPVTFIESVRAYPQGDALTVCVSLNAGTSWQGTVSVSSPALREHARKEIHMDAGRQDVVFDGLPLRENVRRWDEEDGNLYPLTAEIPGCQKEISFGVRDFAVQDGRLALNGRKIFLRGEANCAVFPETGHPPMTEAEWTKVLETYRAYGVNCMRFHSHCPPEAAFAAADRMGMLMQAELSHWNPRNAFETEESYAYYRLELKSILRVLANHPSFVMLTLGNELQAGELGHRRMDALLALAREIDSTRLYAAGSNNHYGGQGCDQNSDFYTSCCFYGHDLRACNAGMAGWLNHEYPNARHTYDASMAALRQEYAGAVVSFEVGQYEALPDFDELRDFKGVTDPANYRLIRDKVEKRGLLPAWKRRVAATGEIALRCYRAEIEAALRTEGLSGISLLGLQDFPGQGTAIVGMLNAHLQPKPFPFARPDRFRRFFTGTLPLALLPRFTYEAGETLSFPVRMVHYGKSALQGRLVWTLGDQAGTLPEITAPAGRLTDLGTVRIVLTRPGRETLKIAFAGHENEYPLWIYEKETPVRPESVYECTALDETALAVLQSGGRVYLSPPATEAALPHSVPAQFSTDFWSVGTFPFQSGAMGQLIEKDHPLFAHFPTEDFTDFQWWPMANSRALILPGEWQAIVTVQDSYARLRPMAQLLECRCGGGRLLLSSMGLQDLQQYPEARALLRAVYRYMASDAFSPRQEISVEEIQSLVQPVS